MNITLLLVQYGVSKFYIHTVKHTAWLTSDVISSKRTKHVCRWRSGCQEQKRAGPSYCMRIVEEPEPTSHYTRSNVRTSATEYYSMHDITAAAIVLYHSTTDTKGHHPHRMRFPCRSYQIRKKLQLLSHILYITQTSQLYVERANPDYC